MAVKVLRSGSLFSGYGGLDMGVAAALARFGIRLEPAWFCEFDEAPSRILAHHWPDVPNFGDVTAVDFASVEQVDVATGGFPCQDVSLAGRRKGMRDGTRSGLWSEFRRLTGQILAMTGDLLPTPTASEGAHGGPGRTYGDGSPTLGGIGRLLPTPAAGNPNDGEGSASWLARRDALKAKGINGNGMGMPLAIAAQLLIEGDDASSTNSDEE